MWTSTKIGEPLLKFLCFESKCACQEGRKSQVYDKDQRILFEKAFEEIKRTVGWKWKSFERSEKNLRITILEKLYVYIYYYCEFARKLNCAKYQRKEKLKNHKKGNKLNFFFKIFITT